MSFFRSLMESEEIESKVKDDVELGGPDEYGYDATDSIENYQYDQEDDDRSDRDADELMKEAVDLFLEADDIDTDDLLSDEEDEYESNGNEDDEFDYIQNGIDLHTVIPHNSEDEQFSNIEESFTGWEDLL